MFIGHRKIDESSPPLLICEIGINHGGSLKEAKLLVDSAIANGAEIIKHQTHIVEDEMSTEAKSITPGNSKENIFDIMNNCALTAEEEYELMQYTLKKGAIFISTPFSRAAADRLETFNVPAYKIGSGECNNYPLIKHVASFGKPMIISTGMNSIESIKPTVNILKENNIEFALLHCTNIYPTPHKHVRLDAIIELKKNFPDAIVGLSDHTVDNFSCYGAIALGAKIIEKHYTDSKKRLGPDISCSMDPYDLKEMLKGIHLIDLAKKGRKEPIEEEKVTINFAFSSVVAIQNIKKGETLTTKNIWVKRPGTGFFKSNDFENLLGKKALKDISKDYQLKKDDIVF